MQANEDFKKLGKRFWANVRTISEAIGYTDRKTKNVRVYSFEDMIDAITKVDLAYTHIWKNDKPTELGKNLRRYFEFRAQVINNYVEPRLMDATRARKTFERLNEQLKPSSPIPMNKQRGKKKKPAYLTAIVNMIIENNIGDFDCDYDPKRLTTITRNNEPLRTLARRVDGCFPSCTNPIAIWEIKEYYHTTTFGSRVADGVYESLLDGLELEELRQNEKIHVQHLFIVDAHYTWWGMGKSYLCRMIDMIHMGYVDEVLFGYEVVERLPEIVKDWVKQLEMREK
ncbi:MAG: hypothetical protein AAFR81_20985 [Chloroflexota bacterium]